MGVFVADDGHYKGWLAAFLCCCAAVDDDESPIERENDRKRMRESEPMTVGERGPHSHANSLGHFPSVPDAVHLLSKEHLKRDGDSRLTPRNPSPVSDRAPSIKPVEFGIGYVSDPRPQQFSEKRGSLSASSQHPSVSASSAFRRMETTPDRRSTLVPLRLGPVVLRDRPDTNIDGMATSTIRSALPRSFSSHSLSRAYDAGPPQSLERKFSSASLQIDDRRSSSRHHRRISSNRTIHSLDGHFDEPTRPTLSNRSSVSSFVRHRGDTSISSMTSRTSSERPRTRRKKSFQSFRRHDGDDEDTDVEKEIIELNTIVEERRAEAARTAIGDQHVPAIAPAMQIPVRSETLDAIGSALSRPQTARQHSHDSVVSPSHQPLARTTSRKRVAGWLSSLLPTTSSSSHRPPPSNEPFYKCQLPLTQRPGLTHTHSEGSLSTILNSPSLTVASSPTTTNKGHGRSETADSYLLATHPRPRSVRSGLDGTQKRGKGIGQRSSTMLEEGEDVGLVGLAL